MKINHLEIVNVRSHVATEFALERTNFIFGVNTAGKTTVAMAIEFLLTGRCDVTDNAGRGAEELIGLGADEFSVAADIEGLGKAKRTKGRRGHTLAVNGLPATLELAERNLLGKLGVSRDVLSAVLNARRFTEMNPGEQKKLLAQALGVGEVKMPAEVAEAWQVVFGEALVGCANLGGIDQAYRAVYEKRTELGRELKALRPPEEVPTEEPPSESAVREKLAGLRREKETLSGRRARVASEYESRRTTRASLKVEAQANSVKMLTSAEAERLTVIAKSRGERDRLKGEIERAKAEIRQSSDQAGVLGKLSKACGLLPAVKCPLTQNDRVRVAGELNEARQAKERELDQFNKELRGLPWDDAADAKLAEYNAVMHRAAEIQQKIMDLGPEEAPLDTGDLDAQAETLELRIEKGEGVLAKVITAQAGIAGARRYETEKADMGKKVAACEVLIQAFGPDGLRRDALGGKLEPFIAGVNAAIGRFGYEATLTLEPYKFEVRTDDGGWLGINQLSQSELYRFSLAFQIGLSEVTGVKLAVIDGADILDGEARRVLTATLAASNLDQAIVLAMRSERPGTAPAGASLFWLEKVDGKTAVEQL